MIPIIQEEVTKKRKWISDIEILDVIAISETTPGPIAVNTATYVGYKKAGVPGGIAATLGMVMPSLLIITMVAAILQAIIDNTYVQHAIMGIRAVVCALMLNTVQTLAKKSLKNRFAFVIAGISLVAAFFSGLPTLVIVVAAAVTGIVYHVVILKGAAL